MLKLPNLLKIRYSQHRHSYWNWKTRTWHGVGWPKIKNIAWLGNNCCDGGSPLEGGNLKRWSLKDETAASAVIKHFLTILAETFCSQFFLQYTHCMYGVHKYFPFLLWVEHHLTACSLHNTGPNISFTLFAACRTGQGFGRYCDERCCGNWRYAARPYRTLLAMCVC